MRFLHRGPSFPFQGGGQDSSVVADPASLDLAGSSALFGVPSAGGDTRAACNLTGISYWQSNYPFIDFVKQSHENWASAGGASVNSDGWLTGLPAGNTASLYVVLDVGDAGYVPPGNYVITSSSAATLSVSSGTGISNISSGVGRATFTVASLSNYSGVGITLLVTNNTGGAINVLDARLFLASEETRLNAGEIFSAATLEYLSNVACIRPMDWMRTNWSTFTQPSHLPKESWRSYDSFRGVPFSICAKLAKRLGCDLWVCVPAGTDYMTYTVSSITDTVTTTRPHGWANGDQVAFYSWTSADMPGGITRGTLYYVINATTSTLQVSTTPGGGPVNITNDTSTGRLTKVNDLAALYDAIAYEVYRAYPDCEKVIVEYSNEIWNFGFDQGTFCELVLSQVAGASGQTDDVKRAWAMAYGMLHAWAAFERYYGRPHVVRNTTGQGTWWGFLSSQFNYVDPGIIDTGQTVGALCDQYSIAPYLHPQSSQGVNMSVGDLLAANAQNQSDAWWNDRFAFGIADNAAVMASHESLLAGIRSGISLSTYEAGNHVNFFGTLNSNHIDLYNRLVAYFDSPAGAAMYESYYQDVFNANGALLYNQFTDVAGYYNRNSQLAIWGLKRSSHLPDTDRMTWFKSLPGKPHSGLGAEPALVNHMDTGHSLSINAEDYDQLFTISSSLGSAFDMQRQNVGGSPIRVRMGYPPGYAGLALGGSMTGNDNINYRNEWTTPTEVVGEYTHMACTERHDLLGVLRWEDTFKFFKAYCDGFLARAADGAMCYLWTCQKDEPAGINASTLADWITYERDMQLVWDAVVARTNLSYIAAGVPQRVKIAPWCFALVRLMERSCLGANLAGITGANDAATIANIFFDTVHVGHPFGRYYLNLVGYVILFRKSPIGAWYPTSGPGAMSSTAANSLQTVAWESCLEYYQRDQVCPTMAETRAYISAVANPAATAHYNEADHTGYFSATTYASGNPFFFNMATDVADAGYFPVP